MKSTFNRNRKKFFLIPLGIVAFLGIVSYVVMELWNNLLPQILHVSVITFWQALGIFILCKILFGFGKGSGGAPWAKRKIADRFQGMTTEERQHFKEEMKDKLCGWKKYNPENS